MDINIDIQAIVEKARQEEREKTLLEARALLAKEKIKVVRAVCETCKSFTQHYRLAGIGTNGHRQFEKLGVGHCATGRNTKQRSPSTAACQSWEYGYRDGCE